MRALDFFLLGVAVVIGLIGAPAPCFAVSEGPLEISAQESLEWYETTRLYVARGQARAVRGEDVVEADILTAHKRETARTGDGKMGGEIDLLTAEGHVRILSPRQKIFGQKAVYDVDKGAFKITGEGLKFVADQNIVTAKESLEYDEKRKMALARGRAVGQHEDSRVEADVLVAEFEDSAQGALTMKTLLAKDNVIITTKDGSVSRGKEAVYDMEKKSAVLSGGVRITRGETQLSGEKALIDFSTGQSRLISEGGGRVRALLPSAKETRSKGGP